MLNNFLDFFKKLRHNSKCNRAVRRKATESIMCQAISMTQTVHVQAQKLNRELMRLEKSRIGHH